MPQPTAIDNQPISSTFFGEGRWLTDFITPSALEVKELHKEITQGIDDLEGRMLACWEWVANRVKYVRFVKGKIWIEGHVSVQDDYWQTPSQLIRTRVGNCSNKAFLLASLLRNDLPAKEVYCVLGNLHQAGTPGGHAWVEFRPNSHGYIMEATRGDMKPMVAAEVAEIYESVVYFNDESVLAFEDRTLLTPFAAVYADWLRDYLDWAYIEGRK